MDLGGEDSKTGLRSHSSYHRSHRIHIDRWEYVWDLDNSVIDSPIETCFQFRVAGSCIMPTYLFKKRHSPCHCAFWKENLGSNVISTAKLCTRLSANAYSGSLREQHRLAVESKVRRHLLSLNSFLQVLSPLDLTLCKESRWVKWPSSYLCMST